MDPKVRKLEVGVQRRPVVIVLFGPPGAGKGTQAKGLSKCLGLIHISTGELLRRRLRAGEGDPEHLELVRNHVNAGRLVPDEVVNQLVEEHLERAAKGPGVILDGYPRTLGQAQALIKYLEGRNFEPVLIHLKAPWEKIVALLSQRRECPSCGAAYNLISKPPKVDEKCDYDGTQLVQRDDDRPEVVWKRLSAYYEETQPLLEHLMKQGFRYIEVDSLEAPPEHVTEKLCAALQRETQLSTVQQTT